jgi:hypothetical protein
VSGSSGEQVISFCAIQRFSVDWQCALIHDLHARDAVTEKDAPRRRTVQGEKEVDLGFSSAL